VGDRQAAAGVRRSLADGCRDGSKVLSPQRGKGWIAGLEGGSVPHHPHFRSETVEPSHGLSDRVQFALLGL
jgi:hypothetical protein